MKYHLLSAALLIAMTGCLRPDEEFSGRVNISGIVTDRESGLPLPGAVVSLNSTIQKQGPIGYLDDHTLVGYDTCDANGAYAFSYEANGETALSLDLASNATHLQYYPPNGDESVVKGIGDQVRNISCARIAYVRVALRNIGPVTATTIQVSGPVGGASLYQQVRDTSVILKIYGDDKTSNTIVYKGGEGERQSRDILARAGDTVLLRFDF